MNTGGLDNKNGSYLVISIIKQYLFRAIKDRTFHFCNSNSTLTRSSDVFCWWSLKRVSKVKTIFCHWFCVLLNQNAPRTLTQWRLYYSYYTFIYLSIMTCFWRDMWCCIFLQQVGRMGSFMMGVDQDKKEEGKLTKTTRDRCVAFDSHSLFNGFKGCLPLCRTRKMPVLLKSMARQMNDW